ncbi:MAG TPA: Tol biopolymer transporter periplasmic protein [Oculatellaceae cyanobacterium]|jgi:Tol biopolymer transport system component
MKYEKALNIVNKSNFFVFRLDNSRFILSLSVLIAGLLSSCTASGRLLNFPFDPGGRSLNSPGAELKPQIADRYIVFISDRRGRQDVYLFDALEQRLVDLPGLNSLDAIADDPSVSEDGRYIVFTANRQGKSGIYLYDRELRQLRNLTENIPAEVRNPTISADGSAIAFESSANGQWDIVIYDRAGQPINVPTYIP